ncbi:NADH-quinone oxidoreductase subunit M [Flavobacterium salilacus subsp. salilacus]|uniref:complex I subunit 4 family protein n=1 Tax=Flavobacterium TaxID=237 RepID=UPI0010753274|nr:MULTISPECIES: NADH-quinone oxidoreductase subunit M [Flavobacterium]KAF2520182.1 NADH-quinone oxidoreductase subunit M [Flavobacterium salilacus subsp. salilacus]MBE1613902.1 NADH-quinone oxidoreductase subunit M [Flavobacterium sp. SaA2.13]
MDVSFILIILLFGAVATYFVGDKWASKAALLFSTAAFAATLYVIYRYNIGEKVSYFHTWISKPRILLHFQADSLSLAMTALTTVLTPIIVLTSFGNMFPKTKSFYALILFMAFAMVGTFLSTDGLVYYIFWELSLIPIYFIALIWGSGDAESRKKAVVKFFIYTFAGSLFMLVSFIYLYTKTGSFLNTHLYNAHLTEKEQFWIFLGFFLAYAIKIPIIPFHTWQANVYQKAPAVGTMLLSGIMLKMALYSIVRWQLPIAPQAAAQYKYIFIALCIAGVIYGSILALKQTDLKKLLAYSSLAHVGLIAAGAYTLTIDGFRGAFLQMIAHGFVVVGLFYAAEIISRRYNTGEIADMGGIRIQSPKFASMFMILVMASVALPLTFNFIGEFEVLYSLAQTNIWFGVLGGTTIILGAFYMLRMFQQVMLGDKGAKVFADVTFGEGFVFALIIGVLLFFGVYPSPIADFITPDLQKVLLHINQIN